MEYSELNGNKDKYKLTNYTFKLTNYVDFCVCEMTHQNWSFFPKVGGLHTVSICNLDRIREFCISYFEISDGVYSK